MGINQSALCKLITVGERNIVNLTDEGFQYCNGFVLVECDYSMDKVVSKLIRVGALKIGKEVKSLLTYDLSKWTDTSKDIPAHKTDYLRESGNIIGRVFKVDDNYYLYNKTLVDIFEDAKYTATIDGGSAILKAYNGDKFIGLALNMRIKQADIKTEMQEISKEKPQIEG